MVGAVKFRIPCSRRGEATGEAKMFESDLAQSFGPEEAHRIAYSDELCVGSSHFGGGKPAKR